MNTSLTILVAVLSGGVTAAFVQLLGDRRDARTIRSQFLAPLGTLERVRWAGEDHGWDELRVAVHDVIAAGVVSRVPQDLVETYCAYAVSAYLVSRDNYELAGGAEPEDAAVDREVNRPAEDLAQLCADAVWRPLSTRWIYRERMWDVQRVF